MGFHVRGVDHLGICGSAIPGQLAEEVFPDAASSPSNKPVVDCRRRTVLERAIAPAATAFQHMDDAADDTPVIRSLDTSHISRQMRLDPLPLLIAQPEKVLAHDPNPPNRIRYLWNQDYLASAAKLMGFDPSHEQHAN
jgi:hypothetical protein